MTTEEKILETLLRIEERLAAKPIVINIDALHKGTIN